MNAVTFLIGLVIGLVIGFVIAVILINSARTSEKEGTRDL